MGKTKLTRSTKLEGNCLNTVQSGGTKMVHKLNPGTYGQVLAPGDAGDFEHVFVGGWLCELPNDSGMNGICETASKGWNYMGQTGHAEILRSNEYSTIGCANNGHIWCCDVGYA
ncbi:hypothetical protein M011DRAFT_393868 [Sporormia fimetaria CBS 119925]|uniref:SCP domain-containing protein n=1 Tax=Sporormia fimetaria CBS 119925 TaxID=1340428 RepID=A0A6A6VQS4_9PLEO|nr:hypothetical protein M011DRAFT_393868 [Sporormia fimetaria CBS 119925]